MKGILTLSQKEVDRLLILKLVDDKKLTVEEASEIMGLIRTPDIYGGNEDTR